MNNDLNPAEWANFILYCFLLVVVLIAPWVPFFLPSWMCKVRPDYCQAYWQHPFANAFCLALCLSVTRILFLLFLYLMAHFSGAFIYPAAYAPYPEIIILSILESWGLPVAISPDTPVRTITLFFCVNLTWWTTVLLVAAVIVTIRQGRGASN